MRGKDVAFHQRTLNRQFREWGVNFAVDVDGQYGTTTRDATVKVMYGLGISRAEIDRGTSSALRIKMRHADRRSDLEHRRERERADWRRRLKRRYEGHGPKAAVAYAKKQAANHIVEHPAGSNTGPMIRDWLRLCGIGPNPWCGAFVNACLVAAGFPTEPWLCYCPNTEARAKTRQGGWSWHSINEAKPGDLVLYGGSVAQHVGLYVGNGVTIEGNTSGGTGGSQDNGGGVFVRRRNFHAPGFPARGVARPPYRG
jgi:hypothetical protein